MTVLIPGTAKAPDSLCLDKLFCDHHDVLLQHPASFILVDLTAAVPSPQLGALSFLSLAYIFSQKTLNSFASYFGSHKKYSVIQEQVAAIPWDLQKLLMEIACAVKHAGKQALSPQRLKLVAGQLVQSSLCPVTCSCIRRQLPAPMGVHCQLCKYSAPQKNSSSTFWAAVLKSLLSEENPDR